MANNSQTIILREFETVGYDSSAGKKISRSDFREIQDFVLSKMAEGQFVLQPGHKSLKARNYVGVLQTRRGRTIEIMPKIDLDDIETEKKIFLKMLRVWRNGPCRNMSDADIHTLKNFPLLEVFINMFLRDLLELTHRGLARSYNRVEDNLYVLKGKLVFAGHLRHNLVHRERFYVQYEEFSANRPVNRLLKSTVLLLHRLSRSAKNQSLIHQARFYFDEIAESKNIPADLIRAKVDRTMPLYVRLFPWVKLFLENSAPATYRGTHLAFALLFPMERIFEDYVAHRLRREMRGWNIRTQESILHLVEKNPRGKSAFCLRPDIVAEKSDGGMLVMDTKWKILNKNESDHGIGQSDLYQMYAYGKKYAAAGKSVALYLLYPWNKGFTQPQTFFYENNLRLQVRPVHLDDDAKPVLDESEAAFMPVAVGAN